MITRDLGHCLSSTKWGCVIVNGAWCKSVIVNAGNWLRCHSLTSP